MCTEPSGAGAGRATSRPLTIVYQLPAPVIVTSSTMMCRFTWYVPGGRYTFSPLRLAYAMAWSIARAESRRPVGSAPNASTLAARGSILGGPTSSESSRSMTVHSALLPAGTVSRTRSPARYVRPRSRRCSS